jgi:hypothetical protein
MYFQFELWIPLDAIQYLSFDGVALFELVDHDGPSVNLSKLCLNIKLLASLEISFINSLNPCYHQNYINVLGLINQ